MISEKLIEDMKAAMKSGDKVRLGVIRMLRAELKNAQIAAREALSAEDEEKVLFAYAKKRRESMDQYVEGGRKDLANREEAEYEITMAYLPPRMEAEELTSLIQAKISETGARGGGAFGTVMKAVMQEAGSRVDGSMVSTRVREMLNGD
ncbi:MAG: GatB/YqeY domain-containing protein [Candidatus Krumholzibacteriia bacterium]